MAKKGTVMTVDNEIFTVELIKEILEGARYEVVTATSGDECLEKLKQHDVDLVLLDVMMSGMSGWDVFEKIKYMNKPNVKVVFLTVLEISSSRRKYLEKIGVEDYITKPFDPDDLVRRVGLVLKK